jgi:succinoglycan biosynthesis transport protein ExoP
VSKWGIMEPRDVVRAIGRHWLLAGCVLLVTAMAVGAGLWLAPKTYVATAIVSAAASPDAVTSGENVDSLRGSVGELANSEDVLEDVAGRLSVDRSIDDLRQSVSGHWVGGTILIEIEVEDEDPAVAAEIANVVAQVVPLYDPSNGALLFTLSNPAQEPQTFSSPNLLLGIGVGIVLALLLGVCAAVLRDRRTNRLDDTSEVEHLTQAPVLAHVSQPRDPTTLPALYPGTSAAEVFRGLRIALEAEASTNPVSVVVVSGLRAGDVNVWLGANLAVSLASVNRKVLLVDGRVGDPEGRPIAAAPQTAGLYDVLNGVPLAEALSQGPVPDLTVLPPGDWGGEASDTLLETRFAGVMAQAAAQFDVVVVLAPTLDRGDDARVMAARGSLILAVPESGVSQRELRRHVERIRSVGVRLLGVVLVGRRAERMAS